MAGARAFAASATHELRTPLQSALTSLDLASLDPTGPQTSDAIASARHDIQRMGSSLGALAGFAEADLADPGWFESIDVVELVDAVIANAARAAGPPVEQHGLESAVADVWPEGVRLAIDNVIRNARSHGSNDLGSPITVTIEAGPLRVIVDDHGPGFGVTDPARLLAAFERGPTDVPGSGLGLAFVERVARVHGGNVALSTNGDGGARVIVTLEAPIVVDRRH